MLLLKTLWGYGQCDILYSLAVSHSAEKYRGFRKSCVGYDSNAYPLEEGEMDRLSLIFFLFSPNSIFVFIFVIKSIELFI